MSDQINKVIMKLDPYRDIVEELLKKEEGWIAELDSLQKELMDKTLHLMEEDNKRQERYINLMEELKELLQVELNKLLRGLKNECQNK